MDRLNLGPVPPIIESVDALTSYGKREIRLDGSVSWASAMKGVIKLKLRNGHPFPIHLQLAKVVFQARVRMLGHLDAKSGFLFGDLEIFAFEKPKFEVKVKTLGSFNLLELPAVGSWVRTVIAGDFFERYLVQPNSLKFSLLEDGIQSEPVQLGAEKFDIDFKAMEKSLRKSHQYDGNYLKKDDWKILISGASFKSQVFGVGSVIAVDSIAEICNPVLCRVVQGKVSLYATWHTPDEMVVGFMNPSSKFEGETRVYEVNHERAFKISTYSVGEYFGEMSFTNPFRDCPPTWDLLYVAEEGNTEVIALSHTKVMYILEREPKVHARFFLMVASSISAAVKGAMSNKNKKSLVPLTFDRESRLRMLTVGPEGLDTSDSQSSVSFGDSGNDDAKDQGKEKKKRKWGGLFRDDKKEKKEKKEEKDKEEGMIDTVAGMLRRGSLVPGSSSFKLWQKNSGGKSFHKIFKLHPSQKIETTINCQYRQDSEAAWITGILIIFQDYLAFYANFFGKTFRIKYPFFRMEATAQRVHNISIATPTDSFLIKFKKGDVRDAALELIGKKTVESEEFDEEADEPLEMGDENGHERTVGLTDKDWTLMLRGAKGLSFMKDQVILEEGQVNFGLYQISEGTVRITKKLPSGGSFEITKLTCGELFGEMSLLSSGLNVSKKGKLGKSPSNSKMKDGGGKSKAVGIRQFQRGDAAGASVVSDEDHVEVYFISGEYLLKQFENDLDLA
eukprot:CAMPEP_0119156312 /NCGR_PEP_ID=MMETSP1310-20130426/52193_1 /TAXON_ID=464262 /ORGANISM="Genus nov. species nov., Strain RCC2339" /LENGTH=729 /DNA_ID=CAMNT_0007148923 /DNA_START=336 /DNA_END=2522 /DNA_ORIENTATION=-